METVRSASVTENDKRLTLGINPPIFPSEICLSAIEDASGMVTDLSNRIGDVELSVAIGFIVRLDGR